MRRLLTGALAAVLPALLVGALTIGCSSGDKGGDSKGSDNSSKPKPPPSKGGNREALETKGMGTLKGRVTLAGDKPNIESMDDTLKKAIEENKEGKSVCLANDVPEEQKLQQTWVLGKDKGVGNVFVWVEPDEKHYFKVDLSKPTWEKEAVIGQPHCAFVPHAAVLFPGIYKDGNPKKDLEKSGQILLVTNKAKIQHNTHWTGSSSNPGRSQLIPIGGDLKIEDLVPDSDPVMINCDIHKWMTGVVRVYDHPYATITDKDGKFELKAPAGAELRVFVWHEAADNPAAGKEVEKVKLDDGKTTDAKPYSVEKKK